MKSVPAQTKDVAKGDVGESAAAQSKDVGKGDLDESFAAKSNDVAEEVKLDAQENDFSTDGNGQQASSQACAPMSHRSARSS